MKPEPVRVEAARDVVIYGCTAGAVIAGVQIRKMGKTVILVCPEKHLGGMSAGGLGWTDDGDRSSIGGLSRNFYKLIRAKYEDPQRGSWKWQQPSSYIRYRPTDDAMWGFEPHVAEEVFEDLVAEHGIDVHRDSWLDRSTGVTKQGAHIVSITTLAGVEYPGSVFIDAGYEGDLLATAGVSFHVGREANSLYSEALNGIQAANSTGHQFPSKISPYLVAGDPASGLLPRIASEPAGQDGAGDERLQAYNFRMCLTKYEPNRVPFPQPPSYDPLQYELLLRVLQSGWREVFQKFDPVPNLKTDTNNHGPFSTDNIGMNYRYPEASYEERKLIIDEHRSYEQGYFYFLANDSRVPADVRTAMAAYGLCKDEFLDNDHWPHQLYVREARRMVGELVMSERYLRVSGREPITDSIGMGSYNMDSHNTQRYVAMDAGDQAYVRNEGDIQSSPGGAYPISYRALVPKRAEADNLLVLAALSASHIAYGSLRMEPVFMLLGQSAGTAAVLAIEDGVVVQDVAYDKLKGRLVSDGQILSK